MDIDKSEKADEGASWIPGMSQGSVVPSMTTWMTPTQDRELNSLSDVEGSGAAKPSRRRGFGAYGAESDAEVEEEQVSKESWCTKHRKVVKLLLLLFVLLLLVLLIVAVVYIIAACMRRKEEKKTNGDGSLPDDSPYKGTRWEKYMDGSYLKNMPKWNELPKFELELPGKLSKHSDYEYQNAPIDAEIQEILPFKDTDEMMEFQNGQTKHHHEQITGETHRVMGASAKAGTNGYMKFVSDAAANGQGDYVHNPMDQKNPLTGETLDPNVLFKDAHNITPETVENMKKTPTTTPKPLEHEAMKQEVLRRTAASMKMKDKDGNDMTTDQILEQMKKTSAITTTTGADGPQFQINTKGLQDIGNGLTDAVRNGAGADNTQTLTGALAYHAGVGKKYAESDWTPPPDNS